MSHHRLRRAVRLIAAVLVLATATTGLSAGAAHAAGCNDDCVNAVEVTRGPTAATVQVSTTVLTTVKSWLGETAPVDVAGSPVFLRPPWPCRRPTSSAPSTP